MFRSIFAGLLLAFLGLNAHAGAGGALSNIIFTKAFGAATVPLNGSTSLTFRIANQGTADIPGIAFADTLPVGLVVDTPNGLSPLTPAGCLGAGVVTATPGSNSVSISASTVLSNVICSFSVNVKGTTPGAKNNSVTIPAVPLGPEYDPLAPSSLTANASLVVANVLTAVNVPTLSEWGLLASMAMLALTALWAFKRRLKQSSQLVV
jgi:hypothetical protein